MFLVSNSDNLTIPNFLQALGFMPPAGMSVEEIIIQQDNQSQAQKTLENSGFEVKEINPNYKTVKERTLNFLILFLTIMLYLK